MRQTFRSRLFGPSWAEKGLKGGWSTNSPAPAILLIEYVIVIEYKK